MDPQATGSFIAQLRKEKNFTQKQLAELLDVSDKAVSRWETGKGFPDTGILFSLAGVLGVSVSELLIGARMPDAQVKKKTDDVILQTMKVSCRKVLRITAISCVLGALLVLCLIGFLWNAVLPKSVEDMLTNQDTFGQYPLGDTGDIDYGIYQKREFVGGFEYFLPNGTERYVFVASGNETPTMAYMHCTDRGRLLGIPIGSPTAWKHISAISDPKYDSLEDYLLDKGFTRSVLPPKYKAQVVDGEVYWWHCYEKDDLFLNYCTDRSAGENLYAYEFGFLDETVTAIRERDYEGYAVTVEDPLGVLLFEQPESARAGEGITLYATKPGLPYESLRLDINGITVGTFDISDKLGASFEIYFEMWGEPITVRIEAK